jgi:N-acetylated-alpha-linked acidic dipeptidase
MTPTDNALAAAPDPVEQQILESVRVDDGWALVEEYSTLVRDSGTEEERQAVKLLTDRLDRWGVPYEVHTPDVLISLPKHASLVVDGVEYAAKTPAMSASTPEGGQQGGIVHEPTGFRTSMEDIFKPYASSDIDVRGKVVVCEGQPMGGKTIELQERGAVGVVFVHPGERIHEGIVTTIWGSPDLTSYERKARIPVVSISRPDGARLIEQISGGSCEAVVTTELDEGWRPIPIVVAEIRGQVEPDRFVLVHGHIDSWHVGVGDNATGDATLLEVARTLNEHRDQLQRSVRVCWWSGHSHGRYAGSAWYAEAFALDLERNCVCHINCDSPGCRDADAYEAIHWMAEAADFAKAAVEDITGIPAAGGPPVRGGDISFNNLGISTFFMLSSHMSREQQLERGLYPVGGCGGNNEWHHEDDTLEIADRDVLLRDMRLYTGSAVRFANRPVHPLDFRATVRQITELVGDYATRLDGLVELDGTLELLGEVDAELERFAAAAAQADSVEAARPFNDALLRIGRQLVPVLYAREGRFRQDPADYVPLLPEFGHADTARGTVPDPVLRSELVRARNRLESALLDTRELARAAGAAGA